MFKSLRVSAVWVLVIGLFSLSELGSLKILCVNSRFLEGCIHAPESKEDPKSCTLHSEKGSTLSIGSKVTYWACLSHGLYFSALFSHPSFTVCFPQLVFILSTNWMVSLGMSLLRKPESKTQFVFHHLAIVTKMD